MVLKALLVDSVGEDVATVGLGMMVELVDDCLTSRFEEKPAEKLYLQTWTSTYERMPKYGVLGKGIRNISGNFVHWPNDV